MKIMVSGGFDPLHVGHLDLLANARQYGDVIVALNSDAWLIRKKGYVFMPWKDRRHILSALSTVSIILAVDDADGTICEALRFVQPDFFANGGDRTEANPTEHMVCAELGIEEMFGIGGDKVCSSSLLVANAK